MEDSLSYEAIFTYPGSDGKYGTEKRRGQSPGESGIWLWGASHRMEKQQTLTGQLESMLCWNPSKVSLSRSNWHG